MVRFGSKASQVLAVVLPSGEATIPPAHCCVWHIQRLSADFPRVLESVKNSPRFGHAVLRTLFDLNMIAPFRTDPLELQEKGYGLFSTCLISITAVLKALSSQDRSLLPLGVLENGIY